MERCTLDTVSFGSGVVIVTYLDNLADERDESDKGDQVQPFAVSVRQGKTNDDVP